MPRARENISLQSTEYDIAGNQLRAYYDKSHNLIFVLDETINADKPNVLLVIDSFDGRKWDDVLSNDYNVELETVRPKRDNKYQKLDIEYGGLDVYSDLIAAYDTDEDLSDAIANLTRFRAMSVRRSAKERLAAAEETIEKSHETIERTNDTILELRARVKDLRGRVGVLRKNIGREPTKASAAKILKTEAQLDATNEKLTRAKKRLTSAQRRLASAEDDAEIARAILARDVPELPAPRKTRAVAKPVVTAVKPYVSDDDDDFIPEPKAEEMDDNDEVKPLFDKDPENLDDEMAFKPISFDTNENNSGEKDNTESDYSDDGIAPAPLAFTPPTQSRSDDGLRQDEESTNVSPMLDSLTSVPTSEPSSEESELPVVEPTPEPVPEPEPFVAEPVVAPVAPVAPVRPVSPITGNITPVENKPQKPTLMYYLLLILLIILSIGTLWLYQKSTSGNLPSLDKVVETSATPNIAVEPKPVSEPVVQKVAEPTAFVAEPVIEKTTVVQEEIKPVIQPEPVIVIEPKPQPVVVSEPEPIAIEPEVVSVVKPEPTVVELEPAEIVVESPFVVPTPVATYEPEPVNIPTEEEIMARKPGYNVSQNEKMFVSAQDYDTDEDVFVNETEPAVISEVEPEIEMGPTASICEGGDAVDSLGCCPGEVYTYTPDGFMCCNEVECFPPAE